MNEFDLIFTVLHLVLHTIKLCAESFFVEPPEMGNHKNDQHLIVRIKMELFEITYFHICMKFKKNWAFVWCAFWVNSKHKLNLLNGRNKSLITWLQKLHIIKYYRLRDTFQLTLICLPSNNDVSFVKQSEFSQYWSRTVKHENVIFSGKVACLLFG